MGLINWQNKDTKKHQETEQVIARDVVVSKQYLEELQKWADLGMRSRVYPQYQDRLQQEIYRLQVEVKKYQEQLKQQQRLQQENSELKIEHEAFRKKIEQEQELRKQTEFKLRVTKQELQEELEKSEAPETITQRFQKQPQLPETKETVDNKKKLQRELSECSKAIREMQYMIKEAYRFEPCRQLCELLVNIRQNVYSEMESIQEDMECVIEAFGIKEYHAVPGNVFDPKYHEQVYSSLRDVKDKKIKAVFSPGFEMDGEIVMKAQVSIDESGTGGANE